MGVVIRGHPGAKHTNYRKFDRHLRRYLESFADGRLETVCLFREPVDWLHSWWRYRGRADIPDRAKSTQGMTFDAFVNACLDGAAGPADPGRQSRFVRTGREASGSTVSSATAISTGWRASWASGWESRSRSTG